MHVAHSFNLRAMCDSDIKNVDQPSCRRVLTISRKVNIDMRQIKRDEFQYYFGNSSVTTYSRIFLTCVIDASRLLT